MTDGIDNDKLKQIVEAALMAADEPLTVERLARLFAHGELDGEGGRAQLRGVLETLEQEAAGRGYELQRVASGYRYQVRQELSEWVSRLWEEKPPRYTRALLETLALIAYRQPVTRGDIEQVRGVAVSPNIMRTLLERGWIRSVGQREVPGKPNLYGTTRAFLDYFNLKSLDQLPPLAEIRSMVEPLVVDEMGGEVQPAGPSEVALDAADESAETPPMDESGVSAAGDLQETPGDAGSEETEQPAIPRVHVEDVELEAGVEVDLEAGVQVDLEDGETDNAEAHFDPSGDEPEAPEDGRQPASADVVRLPTAPRR